MEFSEKILETFSKNFGNNSYEFLKDLGVNFVKLLVKFGSIFHFRSYRKENVKLF